MKKIYTTILVITLISTAFLIASHLTTKNTLDAKETARSKEKPKESTPMNTLDPNSVVQVSIEDGEGRHHYAPSIINFNNEFHVFFCGPGHNNDGSWDQIYYVKSSDGIKWSKPILMLTTSHLPTERAACDPSVFYDETQQHFYMYYSGNPKNIGTSIFMARSKNINGPYSKLAVDGQWILHNKNPDPKPVVHPAKPTGEENWYGAGQSSVVRLNGKTYHWYMDQNEYYPSKCISLLFLRVDKDSNKINVAREMLNSDGKPFEATSVDVKWDPNDKVFKMLRFNNEHKLESEIMLHTSKDGINWSAGKVICDQNCTPNSSNNIGFEGNEFGHIRSNRVLVGYGAPPGLNPSPEYATDGSKWGAWLLTLHFLNL